MTRWDELVRPHLLGELRELDGRAATTTQLARQTPNPYAGDGYDPLDGGCYASYVQPHLQALEAEGLVRRVAVQGIRGAAWQLVTGDTGRARIERTRR